MGQPKKVKCNIFTFVAGGKVLWADVNAQNSCSQARQPLSGQTAAESRVLATHI